MMHEQIFISYSRRDLAYVKPIKEELEANGFPCWMDLEGIESGSPEFTEHIANAVGGSTAVLFFLSCASQKSMWSLNELRLARKRRRHLVLVRFNDDEMSDKFILEFGGTDIIDWRRSEQKSKLLCDLRRWMWGGSIGSSEGGGNDSQSSWDGLIKAYNDGDEAAFVRNAWAQVRSMQAQILGMKNELQSMHEDNQVLLEQSRLTIEKNKLLRHAGQMIVCPTCGKRNMIKDTIYCAACGRALL